MVFVGNTDHTVPYMLKHSDLFDPLPEKFHDSAFLDRIHSYIPGWEVDVIRGEMFSSGYGFVVDYLAEILRSLRSFDVSQIALQFGGGGHPQACGFRMGVARLGELLSGRFNANAAEAAA